MLDGMFLDDDNDVSTSNNNKNLKNPHLNCASYTNKPDPPRGESNFVGLLNQGGTCYMNSSLQILYMNPILRQIIYDLPLCDSDDIKTPSNFIEKNQKYDILIAIQKLFCQLQYLNIHSISTLNLTESFKWQASEGSYQQDSQEFIRLFLFEILERILIGTPYDGHINNLYKILTQVSMTCSNCLNIKTREETNLDICLPVKDLSSVKESLNQLFKNEEIISDYKCEICNQKVDLIKTSKIHHLPLFLNFPLNKFEFDFEIMERIKLTGKYEFPLEIDLKDYITHELFQNLYYKLKIENNIYTKENEKTDFLSGVDGDETIYELYGIIIHRGTPYSGHYFSYIRDLKSEGIWDLQEVREYMKEPLKQEDSKEEVKIEQEKFNDENNKNINGRKRGNNKGKNSGKEKSQNIKGRKNKKGKAEDDEEYSKLNFDFCDHPISYENKDLGKKWYVFDDTSIGPIQVGKLQKQFKSSESAYILFYMKKNLQFQKPVPQKYLINYIQQENDLLEKSRKDYEELRNSLNITIYSTDNLYFDEFEILSLKPDILIDVNSSQKDLKLKFNDKLKDLFDQYFSNESPESPIPYSGVLMYEFSCESKSDNITLIQKYTEMDLDETLEKLKICHNGRFFIARKNDNSNLNCEIIDKYIGADFQPVTINIIFQNKDHKYKTFNNLKLSEFKNNLKKQLNIDYNFDINLKNNNKNISLDKIAFDKKNNNYLTLKQLKVTDKSILIIIKTKSDTNLDNNNINYNNKDDKEAKNIKETLDTVKVSNIVCLEDDRDNPQIITTKLNGTFDYFIRKIVKKFNLPSDLNIRIRKDIDGKIITKNLYNLKIESDPIFVEDSARLTVEFGEPYEENEILLKISYENNDEKMTKELIVDPNKSKISDLKTFVCKGNSFQDSDYMIYKTNSFGDPCKAIKNENQLLTIAGLKDNDLIYLKNVSAEKNEVYLLSFYKPLNYESYDNDNIFFEEFFPVENDVLEIKNPKSYFFNEIPKDNFLFDLSISKESKLLDLKIEVFQNLTSLFSTKIEQFTKNEEINKNKNEIKKLEKMLLSIKENFTKNIRLRTINKKMDADKILKNDQVVIKKLITENPSKILIEILDREENLKDNQTQLYLFERNCENKNYQKKTNFYLTSNENNQLYSDNLYNYVRILFGKNDLTIAKYSKYYYEWEIIPEYDEKGPINLKKSNFNLKDGDWIAVRDDSLLSNKKKDDFSTEEDKNMQKIMKANKIEITKGKANSKKRDEKPLRIITEF